MRLRMLLILVDTNGDYEYEVKNVVNFGRY